MVHLKNRSVSIIFGQNLYEIRAQILKSYLSVCIFNNSYDNLRKKRKFENGD